MKSAGSVAAFLMTTSVAALLATQASAQDLQKRVYTDDNGVDLIDGSFDLRLPIGSIGAGASRLELVVRGPGKDNYSRGRVTQNYHNGITEMIVVTSSEIDYFKSTDGYQTSSRGTGAKLSISGGNVTYVRADGSSMVFGDPTGTGQGVCTNYTSTCARMPLSATSREGQHIYYNYGSGERCYIDYGTGLGPPPGPEDPPYPEVCETEWRLSSVSNDAGYAIEFLYAGGDPNDQPSWQAKAGAKFINTHRPVANPATVSFDSNYSSITDAIGRIWALRFNASGTGVTRPGDTSESLVVNLSSGAVSSLTRDGVTYNYSRSTSGDETTTVRQTVGGGTVTTVSFRSLYRPKTITDPVGGITTYTYNSAGLLESVTAPDQNKTIYAYDSRGNVISQTARAKPGSGLADLSSTASFPATCGNAIDCNMPTWTRDAVGNQTDYEYDATSGLLTKVTSPAPVANAPRPETRYSYTTSTSGTRLLASTSTCRTGSTCVGTADETRVSIGYDVNQQPQTTTVQSGDGALSASTSVAYDEAGNVVATDGPLSGTSDSSVARYDAARRLLGVVGPDPDGGGARRPRAMRITYDAKGRIATQEQGNTADQTDAAWQAFTPAAAVSYGYDAYGRRERASVSAGGTTYGVTQWSYDALGRPDCTAVRMNSASFGSLPAACTATVVGGGGPDRISRVTGYDAANRATEVTTAYGTADQSAEQTSYTPNGQVAAVRDGNGNWTAYAYDGQDRRWRTCFQTASSAACAGSPVDYEQSSYDANGNVVSHRLRDGNTISYGYDALNRLTARARPNLGTYNNNLGYSYDNIGQLTGTTGDWLPSTTYAYDALGRQTAETNPWVGTTSWQYDTAGRRTRLTWNDGMYVSYEYNAAGEMTVVRENGSAILASYGYDDLGRRVILSRGNGTATSYSYDAASRLIRQTDDLAPLNVGGGNDRNVVLSYNAAGQIASHVRDNDSYAWAGAVNVDRPYTTNGLNQYTASGSVALGYDGRGNLTSSAGTTYGYTADNQLAVTAAGPMVYDHLERLFYVAGEAVLFRYEGGELVSEQNSTSGAFTRRYVPGAGGDEPLVWYEGAGTGDKRWLVADERGSVIAATDAAGNAINIKSYDEFGIPHDTAPANGGRFGYTGQMWLPGVGLNYYKARMYSPTLGRFMQTDPIGYGDGLNWYNYVGSDPVNNTDPSGLQQQLFRSCYESPGYVWEGGIVGGHRVCYDRYVEVPDPFERGRGPLRGRAYDTDWARPLPNNSADEKPQKESSEKCPVKPTPPASRTYPIPKGYTPSTDKQNRFVNEPGKQGLQVNPLYAQAMRDAGGTNWKGVAIDLLKIAGSIAFTLRAGEIGGSLFYWDVPDVLRSATLVGSSAGKTVINLAQAEECVR